MQNPDPNPTPVKTQSTNRNPVDTLIDIERKNQILLQKIAQDQAVIKTLAEKQHHTEQRKFWLGMMKYFIYALLIFASFYFTKVLTQNLKDFIPNLTQNISDTVVDKTRNGISDNFEKNIKDKFGNTVRDLEGYLR